MDAAEQLKDDLREGRVAIMWAALVAFLTGVGDYLSKKSKEAATAEVPVGQKQGDAIDEDGTSIAANLAKLPPQPKP